MAGAGVGHRRRGKEFGFGELDMETKGHAKTLESLLEKRDNVVGVEESSHTGRKMWWRWCQGGNRPRRTHWIVKAGSGEVRQ
jgi:hypothetical protein